MANMAVLSPIANFCAPVLIPHTSSDKISSCLTSQVSLKYLKRFPGRFGHSSGDAFSSGKVRYTRVPMRSNPAGVRVEHCFDIEPLSTTDESASELRCTSFVDWLSSSRQLRSDSSACDGRVRTVRSIYRCNCTSHESQETADKEQDAIEDVGEPSGGVAIAVKLLQFYKREISPLLPGSCRFVPTCSEYGMQAFKKYGVVKGAVLTAWRLSRCNPLGGSGFDPPRWFDEPRPPPF